jgi:hypothetical protein
VVAGTRRCPEDKRVAFLVAFSFLSSDIFPRCHIHGRADAAPKAASKAAPKAAPHIRHEGAIFTENQNRSMIFTCAHIKENKPAFCAVLFIGLPAFG